MFDDLEDADMRKRVKTFPKVLEREADAIYRLANQLDRTGKLAADVDLSIYVASAIADRLMRRGCLLGDPFGAWIHETLLGGVWGACCGQRSMTRVDEDEWVDHYQRYHELTREQFYGSEASGN